ncbi:MAG: hypothetical protein V4808_12705 [Pseudomonadota bacterium]
MGQKAPYGRSTPHTPAQRRRVDVNRPPEQASPTGTPTPGATVVFVPNPQTATQAFPPPPPRESYPICKRGQFDGCTQRGG